MTQTRASFDVTTLEGQMKVFNAQNGASTSLKNLEDGTVIEAVAAMQYSEQIESYGKEQDATVTVIFGADGETYAGVSDTVAQAGSKLLDFLEATGIDAFKVKIAKRNSAKGNEFLNLQLVM